MFSGKGGKGYTIMITMSEYRMAGQHDYMGLSTDTKPTNCEVNSLFLELDTGDFYYFDGAAWAKVGGDE